MSFSLKGKIAFVTGATGGGIGRGASFALARRGATIAVTGRRMEKAEELAGAIRAQGGLAEPFVCDVRSTESITSAIDQVSAGLGGIDILLNNAQEACLGNILDVTEEALAAGYESGPLATFRLMKASYPHLKRSGDSVVFNFTSSASVRWDMRGYGLYGGVKSMIRTMSRAAAGEWGPDGIRVLTICPHAMSPGLKFWAEAHPQEAQEFFRTIPLGRVGDPEMDIGEAIVALCQPEFRYLTGATVPLDGGQANLD